MIEVIDWVVQFINYIGELHKVSSQLSIHIWCCRLDGLSIVNVLIHFSNILFSKESENDNSYFEKQISTFNFNSDLKLFFSLSILKKLIL